MRSKRKRKQKDLGSLRAKSGAQSTMYVIVMHLIYYHVSHIIRNCVLLAIVQCGYECMYSSKCI